MIRLQICFRVCSPLILKMLTNVFMLRRNYDTIKGKHSTSR